MGRTALLACPDGGTNLSAMAGLDRSSFNTEPGLRSISFSILWFFKALSAPVQTALCFVTVLLLFVCVSLWYTEQNPAGYVSAGALIQQTGCEILR